MPVRMIGRVARLAMLPADGHRRGGWRALTASSVDERRCRVTTQWKTLMGKRHNHHPHQLQDNIFVGNPFFDDLLAWRHSPEGEQFGEFSDTLCDIMEDVQLDARKRQFIWPDGKRLDLDQSVARIQAQYPDFRGDWIEEYLIDWIDMDYAPQHYSEEQLDELDKLTAQWIADHSRRSKTAKRQSRTRRS
jgi:hypothetical protein